MKSDTKEPANHRPTLIKVGRRKLVRIARRLTRTRTRPRGLAAFLGKISGVNFLRDKVDRHHDNQRLKSYKEEKRQLKIVQRQERQALNVSQRLQAKELDRQIRSLDSTDKREIAALALDEQRDRYVLDRGAQGSMPSLVNLIKRAREQASEGPNIRDSFARAAGMRTSSLPDVEGDFEQAANEGITEAQGSDGGGSALDESRSPEYFKPSKKSEKKPEQDIDRNL